MPTFVFTSPEGRKVRVTGPEGATPEEAFAIAQQQLGIEVPEAAQAPQDPLVARRMAAAETGRQLATQTGDIAGGAEASLRGAGTGLFGVGDALSAVGGMAGQAAQELLTPGEQDGLAQQGGLGQRYQESLDYQRGRRQALEKRYPAANIAGGLTAGIVGAGGAAARAVQEFPRVAATLAPKAGQWLKNTLRMGGTGAAAGGITAANQGDDVTESAAIGAVAAPAVATIAKGSRAVARWGRGKFNQELAGFDALAKRVNLSADELKQKFDDFVAATGRKPGLVEIVDDATLDSLRSVGAARGQAGRAIRDLADEADLARSERLGQQIKGGRTTRTAGGATGVEESQKRLTDAGMREIENDVVPITPSLREFLEDPNFYDALPRPLKRRVAEALAEADDPSRVAELTLRDIENIRQAMAARVGEGVNQMYREFRDVVRDVGTEVSPAYANVLRQFGRRAEVAKGIERGRAALNTSESSEFQAAFRDAGKPGSVSKEQAAGARIGLRTKLSDTASEGPTAAIRTARRLAEDNALQGRMAAVMRPSEAQALRKLGEAEIQAARNIEGVRSAVKSPDQERAEALWDVSRAGAISTGRASGAMIADFARRIANRLTLSQDTAERLARMAFDPKRTAELVERLRARGVREEEFADLFRATGVGTSTMTTSGE